MSSLEPEPDEREENAFFHSVWPRALIFARKKYAEFQSDEAEDAAVESVSNVMLELRKSHEDLPQALRVARVIKGINRQVPRAIKRASRRNLEQRAPDEEGEASDTDDPLASIASNVRTDGPIIQSQGFRVRDLAIEFMEKQEVRDVMELAKDVDMTGRKIAEQLGLTPKVVYECLDVGGAELRRIMTLYVNGEELPPKIEAQLKKERSRNEPRN